MIQVTFLMPNDHQEGAGSFYQRFILAYLFAKENNLKYIHAKNTPCLAHYDPNESENINAMWEEIFLFLGTRVDIYIPVSDFHSESDHDLKTIYHIPFKTAYEYLEALDFDKREVLLEKFRLEFYRNLNKKFIPVKECKTDFIIAIHLRDSSRGDPIKSIKLIDWQLFSYDYGLPDNNPSYYSKLYATTINKIILEQKPSNAILHIHSTGNPEVFSQFTELLDPRLRIKFFLNHPAPLSFLDLIFSDIMIASHSSFSWIAILLRSKKTFIRKDFRHFLTANTSIIEEVLYTTNQTFLQRFFLHIKVKFKYWIFKKRLKKL